MARLVVALVALAIMSAGSMYWASAQQTSDASPTWDLGPLQTSAIGAFAPETVAAPNDTADDSSCCAQSAGCKCDGSGDCPSQDKSECKAETKKKCGGGGCTR